MADQDCPACGEKMQANRHGKLVCSTSGKDPRHMVFDALARKKEVRVLNDEHRKPGHIHH